jgi:hypothetical protein
MERNDRRRAGASRKETVVFQSGSVSREALATGAGGGLPK